MEASGQPHAGIGPSSPSGLATAYAGPRDHGLSCSQLGMSCSRVVVIFERFPRALSFPSGSSYYNALQFSSGFFFSDVLDQSHFSG